ncbi:hypothetical protein [Streptomyces mirabilis]
MKRQSFSLSVLLSLLIAVLILAPHNVHAVTPQPAVTVTAP